MITTRPPLPDTLTPDMPVWVRRSPNGMRRRTSDEHYIEARIVKAARVWVEIEAVGEGPLNRQTWRMRRDTQDEATQYSDSDASFLTEEQYRWQRRLDNARAYLSEQGIRVEEGPWRDREVALADVLRTAAGLGL
jgi:hypothetical protein